MSPIGPSPSTTTVPSGARQLPVQLGVAEQRRAHSLISDLCGLTLGLQTLRAHEARAAGDLERDHDPVAGLQIAHLGSGLLHDPDHLVQVQVRAADAARGHLHDRVGRFLDPGIRNLAVPN